MQFTRFIRSSHFTRSFCNKSSIGNSVLEKTRTIKTKDGWNVVEKVRESVNWNKWSKTQKWTFYGYSTFVTTFFLTSTYSDGKQNLIQYRSHSNKKQLSYNTEYDAVKHGCTDQMFRRFVNSVVFPWTVISNSMPMLVLALNKETTDTV